MISRDQLRQAFEQWHALPTDQEKLTRAVPLIEWFIDHWSIALRQDLAKDQIDKAINALERRDLALIDMRLEIAFHDVAHAPVAIDWDYLRHRLAEVQRVQTPH